MDRRRPAQYSEVYHGLRGVIHTTEKTSRPDRVGTPGKRTQKLVNLSPFPFMAAFCRIQRLAGVP